MSERREGLTTRRAEFEQPIGQTGQGRELSRLSKPRRRRGLATRLTWAFVLVAVVSLVVVGLALTYVSYNAQVEQIVIRQQKTADGAAVLTSEYLTRARDTLSIHGQTASLYGLLLRSFEIQERELTSILTSYGDMFQRVTLLDEEGNELAKVSPFETYDPRDLGSEVTSPAFRQALEGEAYIDARTELLPYATFPTVRMAAPIQPREGTERRGVLMVDVSVEGMWDAVAQVEVGETGYAYIVDNDSGELIAHSDPARSAELRGQSLAHLPVVSQVMAGDNVVDSQYQGLEGEAVIGAASPLPGTNWTLIVELPTEEALAGVRGMLVLLAVLLVLGVLAAAGLGLVIPRGIVQPLFALQEGAREIGAGKLGHVIQVKTGDELQDLAEAFNKMAADLQFTQGELEQWGRELEAKVDERTRELAESSTLMHRRAVQLETSAEVARAIASVRDLDELLPQVTQLISDRFGWYHVGIFLLDEVREYAVLRASNSEGGRRMLQRSHRLKVGQLGIVGHVTQTGQPRIALDVGQDAVYFDNPDLPETRSEMALPLAVGGQIIGALDVQSRESAAYDKEDVALLRTLADQVAIAIQNARLFERTQRALEEVRSVHRQYLQREWAREAAELHDLVYEYRRSGVLTPDRVDAEATIGDRVEGEWPPELTKAISEGVIVALPGSSEGSETRSGIDSDERIALAAPIKLREQVIGVLDLEETDGPRRWTEDEVVLVQAISDQVGLALENARLFADAQRRAEQMATINRIGLSINLALDLKEVLNALYHGLRRTSDVESFSVALYDAETGMVEVPLLVHGGGEAAGPEAGPDSVEVEVRHLDEAPGMTSYVIRSREPLYLPDLRAVPEDVRASLSRSVDQGRTGSSTEDQVTARMPERFADDTRWAGSYLAVPLIFREQVIGVISVQSSRAHAFTGEDVELLATVATQASIAIENARAYERLAETAEELREIDQFKTQFLANMSHELRTPLNSIIGFSRVMLKGIDGPLTDLQEADLRSIYSSGQHLLALINSVLDMSKIEAGKMELSFEEVFLPDILSVVVGTSRALIKDRPIRLHAVVPEEVPTVWADAQRVRQVLLNLMSNAAKFTEEGHIILKVEPGTEFVTISVTDTGVGMAPEAQQRLFIPFQQVDGSTTRRAGGTGLGLAISRSFVEMHGGQIWVESALGEGTTVTFTLPIYKQSRVGRTLPADDVRALANQPSADLRLKPNKVNAADRRRLAEETDGAGARKSTILHLRHAKMLLAIDNEPGVITLFKRYLEGDGYRVIGVTEASQALQVAQYLASELTAITLDVSQSSDGEPGQALQPADRQEPVPDGLHAEGWQILRALKEDPQTRDIPVVLVSIVEDVKRGLELGAAACLHKPITRNELLDVLKRVEVRPVATALQDAPDRQDAPNLQRASQ